MFLFDILIIFAVIYFCKGKFNFRSNSAAQEKLDMMLVNGEISEEDYITKKRILNEMR